MTTVRFTPRTARALRPWLDFPAGRSLAGCWAVHYSRVSSFRARRLLAWLVQHGWAEVTPTSRSGRRTWVDRPYALTEYGRRRVEELVRAVEAGEHAGRRVVP